MMDRELDAVLFDGLLHLVQIRQAHGYRLLADDVLARVGRLDHQVLVLIVVHHDQHHVHVRVIDQLVIAGVALQPLADVLQLLRVLVRKPDQLDPRKLLQHRLMLMPHKAMPNDADPNVRHLLLPPL